MPVVDVDRLKEQGRRFVDGFTPGQKAMTILGVIAVVLAGMTFMKWAATPNYAPLYTGLSSEDAGAVTAAARRAGVKYKIAGGGGTILVSQQDVYKTPYRPQRKGIPAGGATRSRCSTSRASPPTSSRATSTTSARCRASWASTIESIDAVQAASVTLTIPQTDVFVGGDGRQADRGRAREDQTGDDAADDDGATRSCTSSRRASRT